MPNFSVSLPQRRSTTVSSENKKNNFCFLAWITEPFSRVPLIFERLLEESERLPIPFSRLAIALKRLFDSWERLPFRARILHGYFTATSRLRNTERLVVWNVFAWELPRLFKIGWLKFAFSTLVSVMYPDWLNRSNFPLRRSDNLHKDSHQNSWIYPRVKTEIDINKSTIKNSKGNVLRFVLSCCLIEHFNISWSEILASCKKGTTGRISGRITWRKVVRDAAISERTSVAGSIVLYVNVVCAKCWPVVSTSVYSVSLVSWLDLKLNWIVAINVVQRVDKRFTGWSIATTT